MDPAHDDTLLSIGEFSRAAQLSYKALRLYDQIGLFTPVYVDPDSGYRYYSPAQLSQARLIRTMRQMDMPLATIRQVLAAAPAPAEALVQSYLQAQEQRLARQQRLLQDLLAYLRKEPFLMSFEVESRRLEPQPVISSTSRISIDALPAFIGDTIQRLSELARQHELAPAGAPFTIFHGPVNPQEDGPVEICLPVRQLPADSSAVESQDFSARVLPGGQFAAVTLREEYCNFPEILQGYDAAYDWIRANGYEALDPPREVYISAPGEPDHFEILWRYREPVPETP